MHTPDCDIRTSLVKTMEPVKRRVPGYIEPREPAVRPVKERVTAKPEYKNQALVDAENESVFRMDQAINEGQRLADIDRTLIPTRTTLNGEDLYFVAGSDVQNYLDQMRGDGLMMRLMQENEPALDKARMQRQQTWDEAIKLARKLGIDESILMGKTFNPKEVAPRVFALYNAQQGLVDAMKQTAAKIQRGEGNDVDRVNLLRLADRFNEANEAIFGVRATLGRGLNAIKIINSQQDLAAQRKAVQDAIKQFKVEGTNATADELAAMIANAGDDAQVGRAAQGLLAKGRDMFVEYWINSNLSAVTTQMANVMSNAVTAAFLPAETALAGVVGALGKSGDKVYVGEAAQTLKGMIQGTMMGLEYAKAAFRTEQSILGNVPRDSQAAAGAIPGRLGKFVRIPSRLLLAGDQFFGSLHFNGALRALLYRDARKRGLSPADADQFARDAMEGAAEIPEGVREEALYKSMYNTFTNDLDRPGILNTLANAAIQVRRKHPLAALIVPFIRTPVNIVRYVQDRSFAALLDPEIRAAIKQGGPARDEAVSRIMLGTGVSMLALSLAEQGLVMGSPPSDPDERKAWEAAGNRAYSIKIGDTMIQYNRYAPWGLLFGISADLVAAKDDFAKEEDTFKAAQKVVFRMINSAAKNIFEQTMITGITNLNRAITDPDRRLEQVIYSLMAPLVPNIANNVARTFDPTIKEVEDLFDALGQRVPGLRERIPAKRKPLGEEVRMTEGEDTAANLIGRFLLPGFQGQVKKDPAYQLLIDIEYAPSAPSKQLRIGRNEYELSKAQVNELIELSGPKIKAVLERLQNSQTFARLDNERKKDVIERLVRRIRIASRKQYIRKLIREKKLGELKKAD